MTAEIDPFHAISISRLAHKMAAAGAPVIHMEFGQPSTGAPAAAIARAQHVLAHDGMGYWESPDLKARIARHYGETYGVASRAGAGDPHLRRVAGLCSCSFLWF